LLARSNAGFTGLHAKFKGGGRFWEEYVLLFLPGAFVFRNFMREKKNTEASIQNGYRERA
jgi:hypothetical protein